eukprot:8604582-Pyramimonas_sp.AAC.1
MKFSEGNGTLLASDDPLGEAVRGLLGHPAPCGGYLGRLGAIFRRVGALLGRSGGGLFGDLIRG